MHTTTLSVTEMVRGFSDYVNRVAYRGERFILVKGRKPVAELRPLPAGRLLGCWRACCDRCRRSPRTRRRISPLTSKRRAGSCPRKD